MILPPLSFISDKSHNTKFHNTQYSSSLSLKTQPDGKAMLSEQKSQAAVWGIWSSDLKQLDTDQMNLLIVHYSKLYLSGQQHSQGNIISSSQSRIIHLPSRYKCILITLLFTILHFRPFFLRSVTIHRHRQILPVPPTHKIFLIFFLSVTQFLPWALTGSGLGKNLQTKFRPISSASWIMVL